MQVSADVLSAQQACPCTALNELSSNMLEALACIAPALPAQQLLTDPVKALPAALCDVMEDRESPLRLRASAAAAAGGLATAQGSAENLGAGTAASCLPLCVDKLVAYRPCLDFPVFWRSLACQSLFHTYEGSVPCIGDEI